MKKREFDCHSWRQEASDYFEEQMQILQTTEQKILAKI